ncbi:DHA2 family efflux MFS transporter permease subunit [Agromyces sp. NPDC056379]|uniref:DHA2 family efflux MFS transporter permease subunit n=1 Tax=unclassified Agromyces TaxID=2639701 RepID=UPI0035DE3CF3
MNSTRHLEARSQHPTAAAARALSPDRSPDPDDRARLRWWALAALALAQFLVVLDASIVNIAIPSLGADLGLDQGALAWVITAYVLPFGSLLLLGGRLADRFGHRNVFLIGTIGFVAASIAAGLAPDGTWLLAARAVQGASAALLAPASLALVTRLFTTTADRAKALGIWGAVAGAGSAAGVLAGGLLTGAFGWEAVFFVNAPIGAIVLVAIPFLVARDRRGEKGTLDLPGAATVTGGLVALVAGLSNAEALGFGHPLVIVLLVAGVALLAAFVAIERRTASPLVPLELFRNRAVTAGNVVMLLTGAAMVALFFALSVFLQEQLGFDALAAGLSQLPLAGALVIVAGLVPTAVARLGIRPVLTVSLLVLAGGLGWLAVAPANADFPVHVLGPSLAIGIGLGGAFVTATQLAVDGVDGGEAGLAGGLVNTSQQIGGALGLAVLASISGAISAALTDSGASVGVAAAGGFRAVFIGAGVAAVLAAVATVTIRRRATAAAPARASRGIPAARIDEGAAVPSR